MYLQLEAVSTFVLDFLEKYYRILILLFKEKVHLFVRIMASTISSLIERSNDHYS